MSDVTGTPAASRLSARARGVESSGIRVLYELANERDGDTVRLEVGEPDFDTPEHIVDAAAAAAREGDTHYTSTRGTQAARAAISEKLARDNGLEVDPDSEVVVTNGAMEGLYLGLLAVVEPGEEIVLPAPTYSNYETIARMIDAETVYVPLDPAEGFALDAEAVVDAIGPDTGAVVLNSPNNPTGRVFDEDAIAAVAAAAADAGAYVVADEVYTALTHDGDRAGVTTAVDERDRDRVLAVSSCSKEYAMTGWRLGWITGPPDVMEAAAVLHQGTTSCASSVSQAAAVAALTGPQEPAREMLEAFAARRDYVVDRVAELPGVTAPEPEGAFYAFLDVRHVEGSSLEVAKRLLFEHGVATAPGSAFGDHCDGYVRVSYATGMDQLREGFDRIEAFLRAEG